MEIFMDRRKLLISGILFFSVCFPALAETTAYPTRPVRLIVPQPPGGFNDTVSRLMGQKLGAAWNQPVVVENMPGASTQIGTSTVIRANPDGYTLLTASFAHAVNPFLRKLPYDTVKDLKPVILLGETPNVLVVRADSPYKTMEDILTAAKKQPGKLSYASAGPGTSPHLCMEMFKTMAGVNILHVPYKGGSQQNIALLTGEIDMMFDNAPNVIQGIRAGKIRALAVTSAKRTDIVPGVPTVAEQGIPNFEMMAWFGIFAPAGTPDAIVGEVNKQMNLALKSPDVRKAFDSASVIPVGGNGAQFGTYFSNELNKWSKVVKEAKVTVE
jgi:tripartite-type tricarboxylate transporter receptor subunit TctC